MSFAMYDRSDIRPALNYKNAKKPADRRVRVSPRLTDHTTSHRSTMGWEDDLPPKTTFMSDPTSGYAAGLNPMLEKGANCSTWNIFNGFKKAAENAF
jgi:hypothetical protein